MCERERLYERKVSAKGRSFSGTESIVKDTLGIRRDNLGQLGLTVIRLAGKLRVSFSLEKKALHGTVLNPNRFGCGLAALLLHLPLNLDALAPHQICVGSIAAFGTAGAIHLTV